MPQKEVFPFRRVLGTQNSLNEKYLVTEKHWKLIKNGVGKMRYE